MHVPADVLEQTQASSAAMAKLQEKVVHVFWLAELQSVIDVQRHFRTDYRHEARTHIGIWFWDYKLRATGSPLHEASNLPCQWSCEWALLLALGK